MQNKVIDVNFFPGFTRKSITFTMDDGNLKYDKMLLDIVRPAGIFGTFNLCSFNIGGASFEELRTLYRGYEISNHCKYHPIVFDDNMPYIISPDSFDASTSRDYTPEDPVVYKSEIEGIYYIHHHIWRKKPSGWYPITDGDSYCRFIDEMQVYLENIFGEGSVRGYVWPYFEQKNSKVKAHLVKKGYYGARKVGELSDKTGYALPEDRMSWTYNASHQNILSEAKKYEAYPDDGTLKFFSFGPHSADFEQADKWGELLAFAEKYGNRQNDFYYASVGDIFKYEDAVKALVVTDTEIINPSNIPVYIKLDGKPLIITAKTTVKI